MYQTISSSYIKTTYKSRYVYMIILRHVSEIHVSGTAFLKRLQYHVDIHQRLFLFISKYNYYITFMLYFVTVGNL